MRGTYMGIREENKKEALWELPCIIEDLFYIAARLREAGDSAAAGRFTKIAEDVVRESRLLLTKPVLS